MGNMCGVTLRSKYFSSFRGASQRHDPEYAILATAADYPPGKRSLRTAAAGPDASLAAAMDRVAPPPPAAMRKGSPAPAELTANVLGHPTPSLHDHYALGRHDPEYATVATAADYFSSFHGASQRHVPVYATVATAADYPPGKRSSCTAAAGPDASAAAALDGAAPPPAAAMRRGSPAPAELTANVLGHPTPSLHDHYALGRHDLEYATVATAADYFSSFGGASQRHDPEYATVATATDYPPGKRSSRTAAAGPDASAAAAVDGAAPPPATGMRRGSPAPAELTANVLGHPTPSLHDHYALGCHDPEYATIATAADYFSSFRGVTQRHDQEYTTVATAADYPPGKRSPRTTAAGPNASAAPAVDGAAPPTAATMRRGSPAPAELTANVLGHATPSLHDHYALGRKLGQGQFGTTYLCTDRATGADYACKSIAKCKLITKEDVEDVRREIQIMHHLAGHQNVVAIKGAYEGQFHVHIVMELCVGGELFDRIKQRGHYSERKAAELTRIIVGVVEACHSLGVMHRDLKPENFLLANKDDDMSLKAIDFGLSVFFKPGQVFTYAVGSPYYVAPEVLRERYGPEADVWAAGVILYVLLSGVQPFWAETRQGIFDAVLEGVIDFDTDPWPVISDSAKDLIIRMLNPRPTERLTAHEVLRHPWICDHGVAPDRPLDPAVLSCIKQFSVMNN